MDNLKEYFKEELDNEVLKRQTEAYSKYMSYHLPIDGEPVIVGKMNCLLEDDEVIKLTYIPQNKRYAQISNISNDALLILYIINKIIDNMTYNFQIQDLIIAIQNYASRNMRWEEECIPIAEDIAYEMDWNMEIVNAIYLKNKFYQYRIYVDKDMNPNIQITNEIVDPIYWRPTPPKSKENIQSLESLINCDLSTTGLYYTFLHKIKKEDK